MQVEGLQAERRGGNRALAVFPAGPGATVCRGCGGWPVFPGRQLHLPARPVPQRKSGRHGLLHGLGGPGAGLWRQPCPGQSGPLGAGKPSGDHARVRCPPSWAVGMRVRVAWGSCSRGMGQGLPPLPVFCEWAGLLQLHALLLGLDCAVGGGMGRAGRCRCQGCPWPPCPSRATGICLQVMAAKPFPDFAHRPLGHRVWGSEASSWSWCWGVAGR